MDKIWETQRISTAYDDLLRHRDTSRPKKRRKHDKKHNELAASATFDSSNLPACDSTASGQLNGPSTMASPGKRKRGDDEANMNLNAREEDSSNMITTTNSGALEVVQPSASSIPTLTHPHPHPHPPPIIEPSPSAHLTFYLHHPSLPSRHPVLIPLPRDAKLATELSNRIVHEFPTIYVLRSRPGGGLPEGFVSEEEFFKKARKELVEEVVDCEEFGDGGGGEEGKRDDELEEGEVDEGRLLEVLGKDLKGMVGSL